MCPPNSNLILYVAALDYVLADNIGLKSQSYGITMAAGCVGRHPELPIKYLVDGEGPPTSFGRLRGLPLHFVRRRGHPS